MVLDTPGGLFRANKTLFTKPINNKALVIVQEGITWTGWRSSPAEVFDLSRRLLRTEIVVGLGNETAASRNSTVVILNETTGITLISDNIDLTRQQWSWSLDFSPEEIRPGDVIRVTIGNEGVKTDAALSLHAYFSFEINSIYEMEVI